MDELPIVSLYGHSYCHLCADMQRQLESLVPELGAALRLVDIEPRPDLEARFGDFVPVVFVDEREVCHYFLDEAALREAVAASRHGSPERGLPPDLSPRDDAPAMASSEPVQAGAGRATPEGRAREGGREVDEHREADSDPPRHRAAR